MKSFVRHISIIIITIIIIIIIVYIILVIDTVEMKSLSRFEMQLWSRIERNKMMNMKTFLMLFYYSYYSKKITLNNYNIYYLKKIVHNNLLLRKFCWNFFQKKIVYNIKSFFSSYEKQFFLTK